MRLWSCLDLNLNIKKSRQCFSFRECGNKCRIKETSDILELQRSGEDFFYLFPRMMFFSWFKTYDFCVSLAKQVFAGLSFEHNVNKFFIHTFNSTVANFSITLNNNVVCFMIYLLEYSINSSCFRSLTLPQLHQINPKRLKSFNQI